MELEEAACLCNQPSAARRAAIAHGWETADWGPWPGPLPVSGASFIAFDCQIRALSAIGAIAHVLLVMQNASFCHTERKNPSRLGRRL